MVLRLLLHSGILLAFGLALINLIVGNIGKFAGYSGFMVILIVLALVVQR